jgi:hypothetical protein
VRGGGGGGGGGGGRKVRKKGRGRTNEGRKEGGELRLRMEGRKDLVEVTAEHVLVGVEIEDVEEERQLFIFDAAAHAVNLSRVAKMKE